MGKGQATRKGQEPGKEFGKSWHYHIQVSILRRLAKIWRQELVPCRPTKRQGPQGSSLHAKTRRLCRRCRFEKVQPLRQLVRRKQEEGRGTCGGRKEDQLVDSLI